MKKIIFPLILVITAAAIGGSVGCSRQWSELKNVGERSGGELASYLKLYPGDTTIFEVGDYFPGADDVDSIVATGGGRIIAGDHKGEYRLVDYAGVDVVPITVYMGAERADILAIRTAGSGSNVAGTSAASGVSDTLGASGAHGAHGASGASGAHGRPMIISGRVESDDIVKVEASDSVDHLYALWQNILLPAEFIQRRGDIFKIRIPDNALGVERSFMRIIGVGPGGLTNDLLIPLEQGRVVRDASQLTRRDKQAQIIYSLMIDRFKDGDTTNNRPLADAEVLPQANYQGGDIVGITQKIKDGYFGRLGINTIWISPVTENPQDAWGLNLDPRTKFSGYHGYWPVYTTVVDNRFATPEQLREMLTAAHDSQINVLLDYVSNHLHQSSPVLKAHPDWVTPATTADGRPNIALWDEYRLTTWFDKHIPTLDLERTEVADAMSDSALYWLSEYDFDGFRHDASKHVPQSYWRMLTRKIKERFPDRTIYQIGETYGSPELIDTYVRSGMLDAQFDFNVYDRAIDVFAYGAPMNKLNDELSRSLAMYGHHNTMGYITGNHDRPRFISLAGGALKPDEDSKAAGWKRKITVGDSSSYQKLAMLEAFMLTIPGVPVIYQGDEFGVPGGNDPDNRRMMNFKAQGAKEQMVADRFSEIAKLRRSSMPLMYGDYVPLYSSADVLVFARVYMGEVVLVAINTSNTAQRVEMSIPFKKLNLWDLRSRYGTKHHVSDSILEVEISALSYDIFSVK